MIGCTISQISNSRRIYHSLWMVIVAIGCAPLAVADEPPRAMPAEPSASSLPPDAICRIATGADHRYLVPGFVMFSADGKLIKAPGGLWNATTGTRLVDTSIGDHSYISLSRDGGAFLCSNFGVDRHLIRRRVAGSSALVHDTDTPVSRKSKFPVNANDLLAQAGAEANSVEVWNTLSHKRIASTVSADVRRDVEHPSPEFVASPDLMRLAWISSTGGGLRFWNIASGELISEPPHTPRSSGGGIASYLMFSGLGKFVALPTTDHTTLSVVSTAKGAVVCTIPVEGSRPDPRPSVWYAFSKDERRIFTTIDSLTKTAAGSEIRQYDLAGGQLVRTLTLRSSEDLVAFLCSSDADYLDDVDQWNASAFLHARYPPCHLLANLESNVSFSGDGNLIAILDAEGTVSIWERASRTRVATLGAPGADYDYPLFSPDGRRIAVRAGAGGLVVFDVTFSSPLRESAADLDSLWSDLGAADGRVVRRAIWEMGSAGDSAVAFIERKLERVEIDDKRIDALVAELDSDEFASRQKAVHSLEELGRAARGPLTKRLERTLPLEVRNSIRQVLESYEQPIRSAQILQGLRAMEICQHIATSRARALLERLGEGNSDGELTQAARSALRRTRREMANGQTDR